MTATSSRNPNPSLGVCYYPEQWPPEKWTTDLDAMRDLGIRFVRIGEFAWSQLEPNPGEYRFALPSVSFRARPPSGQPLAVQGRLA